MLLADAVEHVEVVLEDGGGLLEGIVRRDAAVGPDLEDQLVVIGDLADTGVLDRTAGQAHGAEKGIDRDDADRLVFLLVCLARAVAAAGLDLDLGFERARLVERASRCSGLTTWMAGSGWMSAAVTGPSRLTLIASVTGSRFWETMRIFFRLRTMSVTSSTTLSLLNTI